MLLGCCGRLLHDGKKSVHEEPDPRPGLVESFTAARPWQSIGEHRSELIERLRASQAPGVFKLIIRITVVRIGCKNISGVQTSTKIDA